MNTLLSPAWIWELLGGIWLTFRKSLEFPFYKFNKITIIYGLPTWNYDVEAIYIPT